MLEVSHAEDFNVIYFSTFKVAVLIGLREARMEAIKRQFAGELVSSNGKRG